MVVVQADELDMREKLTRILRFAIALVWFYQGAWLKIIAVDDHHLSIIDGAVPFGDARVWLFLIGAFETGLAIWFLIGWKRVWCGWIQVSLLVGMNTVGILTAGDEIPDPAGMVTMNLVFIFAILLTSLSDE